jgi:hypothetical protein
VKIFGPVEEVSNIVTEAPEGVSDRSVTLKGTVEPEESPASTCLFQYATEAEFKAHRFEGAPTAPCHPEGPFTGNGAVAVEAQVTELRGGTTYHERLVGENASGTNPGEDIPFTTLGPSVSGTEAFEIGESEATLKATVDPRGTPTSYHFEYLTRARLEAGGWAAATKAPPGGVAVGAGETGVEVSQRVEGLQGDSAYLFRVVALSSGGESEGETDGEAVSFATYAPPTVGLPDGRRYEQATPTDKNGANAEGEFNAVEASVEGGAIAFFSNSGIGGGEGAQEYPTYLSSRSPDGSGWSTQGLLPPASYGTRAEVRGWSEDLSQVFDTAGKAFGGARLLRRDSAGGAISVIGGVETSTSAYFANFTASSAGGRVALFESEVGGLVEGDLEGAPNLYAYGREGGELALAGVLNDGSEPSGGARTGSGLKQAFNQQERAISTGGDRVFFTALQSGRLYVRENPLAPQSAMSGERCAEAAKACTVWVSAPEEGIADPGTPAQFVGASASGDLVYFLDKGKLTADSTAGTGSDLYRYELGSGRLVDLTAGVGGRGAQVEGLLGTSEDGGVVYLAARGALAEGATRAPDGEVNLYSLQGGEAHFIARLGSAIAGGEHQDGLNWAPTAKAEGGGNITITRSSRVSRDGRTLLFTTTRPLSSYRNRGEAELYLYRAGRGVSCVSCNPTGEAPSGPAGVQLIPKNSLNIARTYSILTRNLSADGRRVIFDSPDRLLAADHNNVNDVYEWEEEGKGSCAEEAVSGGCLYLLSGGAEGAGPSYFADADEEGENAFIFTAQRLVAQDRDELVDIYDARVGGGIASQEATPPTPCEGEGCLGSAPAAPAAPAASSPATSAFAGPGNLEPPKVRRCPRHKVRRRGRCVRRHAHRKRHRRHHRRRRHGARAHAKGRNRR